ncbi:hypothetical protein HK101_009161 [Irineochytrium annulatum]|nr:hypothetical protein HK101_009161 [Irineochytrium annulatum]
MSFIWDQVDARQRRKLEKEREVSEFLKKQQEEAKNRKLSEKMNDRAEYQRMYNGGAPTVANPQPSYRSSIRIQDSQPALAPAAGGRAIMGSFNPISGGQISPGPPPPQQQQMYAAQQSYQPRPQQAFVGTQYSGIPRDLPKPPTPPLFRPYEPTQPPQASRLLALPAPGGDQPSSVQDEILTKLRLAEETIASERRTRSWLETELQLGKTLVATLSAKVERMQESISGDGLMLRDLSRKAEDMDRRAERVDAELVARMDREQNKLSNLVADLTARLRGAEQREAETSEKGRMMMDELHQLRHGLESFSIRTMEVGNEVRNRVRDWEAEVQRTSDVGRAVREHDGMLENLQRVVEGGQESLGKRLEMGVLELRGRMDTDARARYVFETGMRDLFQEVKKGMMTMERDLHERVEGARSQATLAMERERQDRDRGDAACGEGMRHLEKSMREAMQVAVDKMDQQVRAIEESVAQERMARGKFEAQIKTEVQDDMRMLQEAMEKKFGEIEKGNEDTRQAVAVAIKTLKESIVLIEKAGEQKLGAIEEVLRAEVKTRMETDRTVMENKDAAETRAATLERRAFEAIADVMEDTRSAVSKLEEELRDTAEQLTSSKSRMIEDLESQLSQVRKRVKENEAETSTQFRAVQLAGEQVGRDAKAALEASEARAEARFAAAFVNDDELAAKIRAAELRAEGIKVEVEDRINARALLQDATFEAFKEELDLRATKRDEADMEKRFEASMGNVSDSVNKLVETTAAIRDEIELRASRKEVDELEARTKGLIHMLQARATDMDATVIAVKEDVASRATKKEAEDLEERIKGSILDLQVRDAELENQVARVREEVATRVSREQMFNHEERMREHLSGIDARGEAMMESISDLRDAIALRATRIELNGVEDKVLSAVSLLEGRIQDTAASVLEAKGEISKAIHDDLEEMIAKINEALKDVRDKVDFFEGQVETVKLRVSDADVGARSRLQQVTSTLEALIAEHATSLAAVRELTRERLEEFSTRLDDVPHQLSASELKQEDFRRRLTESHRADQEKTNGLITSMRESVARMVTEQEFDRLQSDLHSQLQRLQAQVEIEALSAEQARVRVNENDAASRERHRELKADQERHQEDQALALRSHRDTIGKKMEELENRLIGVPKALEQAWGEIRRVRSDVDDKVRTELTRVEKDLALLRGSIAGAVDEKGLESALRAALGSVAGKLERANVDVLELRAAVDKLKVDVASQAFRIPSQRTLQYTELARNAAPAPMPPPQPAPPSPRTMQFQEMAFRSVAPVPTPAPAPAPPSPRTRQFQEMARGVAPAPPAEDLSQQNKAGYVPASFFKPSHIDLKAERNYAASASSLKGKNTVIIPPENIPRAAPSTTIYESKESIAPLRGEPFGAELRTTSSTRALRPSAPSDPQLERIADLATSKGELTLPPISKAGSNVSMEF